MRCKRTHLGINLLEYPQARCMMRKLKMQGYLEIVRAPTFSFEVVTSMFKQVSEDNREYQLMLVAFVTAARIGHLEHLYHVKMESTGWRVQWTMHKTYADRGPVDVIIPKEYIPKEILSLTKALPGPICTAEERADIYALMEEAYKGRTYTIRRSALQYYRYEKNMTLEQLKTISLHADTRSLEKYLASNKVDFE